MEAKYRILTADYRIKFTGSSIGSWFTLDKAERMVDRSSGEMIFEYNQNGDRLWEVL